ncbi:MFS transporter [Heyndrickxia faecalis]|uniref:MFS transporter n=1 Tax=Heyndrickxia faecalis TaxID=2824910 RepID=UPI003D1D037B
MKQLKQYLSYAFGAFGHDAFYSALSTYFMIFVTSQLFDSTHSGLGEKMIGIVTTMIVVIRIAEITLDPFIGGIIDVLYSIAHRSTRKNVEALICKGFSRFALPVFAHGRTPKPPLKFCALWAECGRSVGGLFILSLQK